MVCSAAFCSRIILPSFSFIFLWPPFYSEFLFLCSHPDRSGLRAAVFQSLLNQISFLSISANLAGLNGRHVICSAFVNISPISLSRKSKMINRGNTFPTFLLREFISFQWKWYNRPLIIGSDSKFSLSVWNYAIQTFANQFAIGLLEFLDNLWELICFQWKKTARIKSADV